MNQIKNHTQLLNYLAETFNLQSYLEIGLGDGVNFKKINCPRKTGVDPEAKGDLWRGVSDDFFYYNETWKTTWDLIFIDGLHHADQVKRDFENSLKCLTDNGFIVIHDTLPTDEKYTHVPRDSKIWFGDVYKFAVTLHSYGDISEAGVVFYTLDIDCGCTVVFKGQWGSDPELTLPDIPKTFIDFQRDKDILLQIISVKDFVVLMDFMAKYKKEYDRLHRTIQ